MIGSDRPLAGPFLQHRCLDNHGSSSRHHRPSFTKQVSIIVGSNISIRPAIVTVRDWLRSTLYLAWYVRRGYARSRPCLVACVRARIRSRDRARAPLCRTCRSSCLSISPEVRCRAFQRTNNICVTFKQQSLDAHAKINRKMGNSTPCKIVTPENIILKLCIRDYVGEMTHHANFSFNRSSGGFSLNRRNVTILWLFLTVLSCPYRHRSDWTASSAPHTNIRTQLNSTSSLNQSKAESSTDAKLRDVVDVKLKDLDVRAETWESLNARKVKPILCEKITSCKMTQIILMTNRLTCITQALF